MNDFRRAKVGPGARTLTGPEYTSEEVFRTEVERIFAPGWMAVARAEELSERGGFRTLELLGEPLLLIQTGSEVRGFFNVCRHRGSVLCEAGRGLLPGQTIVCPYHAWTYALDGRLVAARNMADVPGFDTKAHSLATVAVAEWEGFLFVSFEPRRRFRDVFALVWDRFTPWGISRLRVARSICYDVQANWKQIFENYSECYHCPLIHPALERLSPSTSGHNDLSEGPFLGGYMHLAQPDGSLTTTGRTVRPPLPGLAEEHRGRVWYYSLMPNLLLSLHPDYVMAHLVFPESARRTRIVCQWLFAPEVMAEPGFDPDDAVCFWDETNRQDWRACERSLIGLASRAYQPGPYAHAEGLLDAFDREYRRQMAAETGPA